MSKFLALILLAFQYFCFAQSNYKKIVDSAHRKHNFNGTVLVANKGKIEFLQSVGIANRQTGTKIEKNTKFKIASITKTFTAVLILKLYEQGKIDLKSTIENYYPEYKGQGKSKVTIHNLLT